MQNRKRDTDTQNRLLDSVGEGEGGMFWDNSIETCILSRVKQITSPGWMHETSAWTWCTEKTQRNLVEREVGGGSGWGIHVNPWLIHVNVWQKPLQYCKVISLQLIKINGKKIYGSSQYLHSRKMHLLWWRYCPWNLAGKIAGVGWHFLLQGMFLTQGSNPDFLHWRQILYRWAIG